MHLRLLIILSFVALSLCGQRSDSLWFSHLKNEPLYLYCGGDTCPIKIYSRETIDTVWEDVDGVMRPMVYKTPRTLIRDGSPYIREDAIFPDSTKVETIFTPDDPKVRRLYATDGQDFRKINYSDLRELVVNTYVPDLLYSRLKNLERLWFLNWGGDNQYVYVPQILYDDLDSVSHLKHLKEINLPVYENLDNVPEFMGRMDNLKYFQIHCFREGGVYLPLSFMHKAKTLTIGTHMVNPETYNLYALGMCKHVSNYNSSADSIEFIVAPNEKKVPKNGLYSSYYTNGKLLAQGKFKKSLPDGKWTFWYRNGNVYCERFYKDGVEVGTWRKFLMNGDTLMVSAFENGKLVYSKKTMYSTFFPDEKIDVSDESYELEFFYGEKETHGSVGELKFSYTGKRPLKTPIGRYLSLYAYENYDFKYGYADSLEIRSHAEWPVHISIFVKILPDRQQYIYSYPLSQVELTRYGNSYSYDSVKIAHYRLDRSTIAEFALKGGNTDALYLFDHYFRDPSQLEYYLKNGFKSGEFKVDYTFYDSMGVPILQGKTFGKERRVGDYGSYNYNYYSQYDIKWLDHGKITAHKKCYVAPDTSYAEFINWQLNSNSWAHGDSARSISYDLSGNIRSKTFFTKSKKYIEIEQLRPTSEIYSVNKMIPYYAYFINESYDEKGNIKTICEYTDNTDGTYAAFCKYYNAAGKIIKEEKKIIK
ncbi:MAG: hypothetical protein ACKOXB_00340 [Flavobacteriales bacterium]